jgi:hypothetical protein
MDRHDRKPKQNRAAEPDPALLAHIRSVGLANVEDYLGWCAEHGFSRRTDKHWRRNVKAFFDRHGIPKIHKSRKVAIHDLVRLLGSLTEQQLHDLIEATLKSEGSSGFANEIMAGQRKSHGVAGLE